MPRLPTHAPLVPARHWTCTLSGAKRRAPRPESPMQLLDRPEALGTPGDAWIDGVRLHFVEAGSGPPVILLHGFPEFWYSWRNQIPALAAAGFHVLAPDLRGYDLSDKPEGVEAYRI